MSVVPYFVAGVELTSAGSSRSRIGGEYVVQLHTIERSSFADVKVRTSRLLHENLSFFRIGDFMGFSGPLSDDELEIVKTMPEVSAVQHRFHLRSFFWAANSS